MRLHSILKDNFIPKGDKPTLKQQRFAKIYAETGNATEAAMQVYNPVNRNVAQGMGSENLAKPIVMAEVLTHTQLLTETVNLALQRSGLLEVALRSALKDCGHDDPKVRDWARKSASDLYKLGELYKDNTGATHNHLHLAAPKRNKAQ